MLDKRNYNRIPCNIKAVMFKKGLNREVTCIIKNISETGILIQTNKKDFNLNNDDTITIEFYDEIIINKQIYNYSIIERVIIKHIEESETSYSIGGYINSNEYKDYIIQKEISINAYTDTYIKMKNILAYEQLMKG